MTLSKKRVLKHKPWKKNENSPWRKGLLKNGERPSKKGLPFNKEGYNI